MRLKTSPRATLRKTHKIDIAVASMPVTEEIQTFAAFQGKVSGNTIMGVSLIQEGPALGHGVFVDRKSLGQFKALAMQKGRVKAKLNHFSSVQDTVGYYENFRVSKGKLLADLTLFETHGGKEMLLEMINEIPSAFGVSLMFAADSPELDKESGNYMTRPRGLYSADFVDTPAANADGVFSADQIDSEEPVMGEPSTPPEDQKAAEAPSFVSEFSALSEKIEQLAAQMAAYETKLATECEKIAADIKAFAEKPAADVELQARLAAAAPAPAAFSAPINEPEVKVPAISYHEAKNQAIGTATGLDRLKAVRAFTEKFPTEAAYVSANS